MTIFDQDLYVDLYAHFDWSPVCKVRHVQDSDPSNRLDTQLNGRVMCRKFSVLHGGHDTQA